MKGPGGTRARRRNATAEAASQRKKPQLGAGDDEDHRVELARDPNSTPHELAALAEQFPREVLANPALTLVALERPDLWVKICASATTSLVVGSLERELRAATSGQRRRFALACAERACASWLPGGEAPLTAASAALETLRRWLAGGSSFDEVDHAADELTSQLASHLARAPHGAVLAVESARLALQRGSAFRASEVAFVAARSAGVLALIQGVPEHSALGVERRWQLSALRQLGRGRSAGRPRVAGAARSGKLRSRGCLLDRPRPRVQGWPLAMKRRPGREELEAKLAEAERVLAYVAELSEQRAGGALERAGEAAREALARLSMADDEALTGASRPRARLPCDHHEHRPDFDPEAACGLEADEIAVRWPPFEGRCGRCGAWVLVYASATHEVLARW